MMSDTANKSLAMLIIIVGIILFFAVLPTMVQNTYTGAGSQWENSSSTVKLLINNSPLLLAGFAIVLIISGIGILIT